jgi:hypothetical protein
LCSSILLPSNTSRAVHSKLVRWLSECVTLSDDAQKAFKHKRYSEMPHSFPWRLFFFPLSLSKINVLNWHDDTSSWNDNIVYAKGSRDMPNKMPYLNFFLNAISLNCSEGNDVQLIHDYINHCVYTFMCIHFLLGVRSLYFLPSLLYLRKVVVFLTLFSSI